MKKRMLAAVLALIMVLGLFPVHAAEPAAGPGPTPVVSDNLSDQNYWRWSKTVKSYLEPHGDHTLSRVEADGGQVILETYDENRNLLERRVIAELARELPIFGGCYFGAQQNFLVFGQENPQELDSQEVIRVVSYTKDWQRLKDTRICGANTYIPFDAGSLRMTQYGDHLYIRTCHEMYQTDDGYHHQANVMLNIHIPTMELRDQFWGIMNIGYGYVSHSFNQFVALDGDRILAVDHGDAHPRSVVLVEYPYPAGQDQMISRDCKHQDLVSIPGTTGDNETGVGVGGFEVTDSSYLVAGVTVDLSSTSPDFSGQENVFLSVVPRGTVGTQQVSQVMLTAHQEGENCDLEVPQLVKLDGNRLMVLWTEQGTLCWQLVDGAGQPVGSTHRNAEGKLSDCKPVVQDGKAVWYVTDNSVPMFYAIALDHPETLVIQPTTQSYTVTVDGVAHADVKYGTALAGLLPENPTKPGYIFTGWYAGEKAVTGETLVTGDMTIESRWEAAAKSITAKINGTAAEGATLAEVITASGVAESAINSVEFISGHITYADLVKAGSLQNLQTFKCNLSDTLTYEDSDGKPATDFPAWVFCYVDQNYYIHGHENLRTVELNGFTEIPKRDGKNGYVFGLCFNLQKITALDAEYIGPNAFKACLYLETLTIPSVRTIGGWALNNTPSLKLDLSQLTHLETIGDGAFQKSGVGRKGNDLVELTLPASLRTLEGVPFGNYGDNTDFLPTTYHVTMLGDRPVVARSDADNCFAFAAPKADSYVEVPQAYDANYRLNDPAVNPGYDAAANTWCMLPMKAQPVREINIQYTSMVLKSCLEMRFYLDAADLNNRTDLYAKIVKSYADGRPDQVVEIPYAQWGTRDPGLKYVKFAGITAKEMMDEITVQIFDTLGQPVGQLHRDSVQGYAMRALAEGREALDPVLVDMLNYGAAAQTYFKYDAGNLANAALTPAQQALATTEFVVKNEGIAGAHFYGSTLVLQNSITMNLYFRDLTSDMHAVATYTDHYGDVKTIEIPGSQFVEQSSLTRISINSLAVADAYELVHCQVYDAGNQLVGECHDSIASYAARGTERDDLRPVVEGLLKFSTSSRTYFATK